MSSVVVLAALAALMVAAYRGYSVVLCAPAAALGAVLLTAPDRVAPAFTGLYMDKVAGFLRLYLPVFVLGAVFGRVVEAAGFSRAIAAAVVRRAGPGRAIPAVVAVCAVLTYGGVSLFVVVFAVYPFAADLFRRADVPKRLIPGTIALGAFTFTMDCLPGSPQIQNIIPTAFFGTDLYAAPGLGLLGAAFILAAGLPYLDRRRRLAAKAGEGYGTGHTNEPPPDAGDPSAHPLVAVLPLLLVAAANRGFALAIARAYGETYTFDPSALGGSTPVVQDVSKVAAVWAVEGALVVGILAALALGRRAVGRADGVAKPAVAGALLAAANTASEYGFGAVVASLPGFRVIAAALASFADPLVNAAVSVTALAGLTGSASGGLSIALAALGDSFATAARFDGVPMEVLHRVAAMASGGMDTLPHNGAVITLLTVTGLTHRQAYRDVFAVTLIKTAAVFVVIAAYRLTGMV